MQMHRWRHVRCLGARLTSKASACRMAGRGGTTVLCRSHPASVVGVFRHLGQVAVIRLLIKVASLKVARISGSLKAEALSLLV
eukprot:363217-Chlamydomonas_euryale.AAC.7